MKSFLDMMILMETAANVTVDLKDYEESLTDRVESILAFHRQEKFRLQSFKPDMAFITNTLQQIQFPYTKSLLTAMNSKSSQAIHWSVMKMWEWVKKNTAHPLHDAVYKVIKMVHDYSDVIHPVEYSDEMAEEEKKRLVAATTQNMNQIKASIEQAIMGIAMWNGSPVTIKAREIDRENNFTDPQTDAEVVVGNIEWSPSFTLFVIDGRYQIDDVYDAAEDCFRGQPKVSADYFNLIKEIRHPGTQKEGRLVTLYTARPVSDRQRYMSAKSVPSNIYATTSWSSARDIGLELAGRDKIRDVWRIKINSMYLVNTLDMPGEKQYQIIGPAEVPVESMTLVDPGE